MKKVLFATTALVATAGIAAADVALSGSAEMGVIGGSTDDVTTLTVDESETRFHTDIDVTFTLSGETDGGITFGAAVDLDENSAFDPDTNGGIAVFISGDFGTLTMGDTDGALDWAMQDGTFGNAGSIADDETSHAGYLGSYFDGAYDGQILRYDYAISDFAFAVSVELDDLGVLDPGYAIGATYNISFGGGSATIGAGYQFVEFGAAGTWAAGGVLAAGDVTTMGISASVALDSGFSGMVGYTVSEDSAASEQTHVAVGAGYTFDAITVAVNYGMFEDDQGFDASGYGLSASYDFGGGLSAHLGYGNSDDNGATSNTFSLGLAMSF